MVFIFVVLVVWPTQVIDGYCKKGCTITTPGCTICFRCVEMYPEKGALNVKIGPNTVYESKNWLAQKD